MAVVLAQCTLQICLVRRFDDRVQAGVSLVDVELGVHFSRRQQVHAAKQQHGEPLVHVRGILRVVSKHERLQPEKLLRGHVPIEVHTQSRLDPAAAAPPAGTDADVPQDMAAPPEVARVVRVIQEVVLQRLPIPRIDVQPDFVKNGVIEELVRVGSGLRRRRDAEEPWAHLAVDHDARNGQQKNDEEYFELHCLANVNCPDVNEPPHELDPA